MTYQVIVAPSAQKLLEEISDRRICEKILFRIGQLAHDPEKQGKPLIGELFSYRSIRVAGERYRVIYTIKQIKVHVFVIGIRKEGSKKDVYELAQKLLRQGLLGD